MKLLPLVLLLFLAWQICTECCSVTRPNQFSFHLFISKGLRGISFLEKLSSFMIESARTEVLRYKGTSSSLNEARVSIPVLQRQHGQSYLFFLPVSLFRFVWQWLQYLNACAGSNVSHLMSIPHWVTRKILCCPCLALSCTYLCSVGSIRTLQPAPFLLLILTLGILNLLRKSK